MNGSVSTDKNKFPQFPGERSGVDCSENESTAETNGN
jgi:hypothetical protein